MALLQSRFPVVAYLAITSLCTFATSETLLPYPHSLEPLQSGDVLFAVATNSLSCFSDVVTVEALAGVLSRSKPQVYTVGSSIDPNSDADAFWLSQLQTQSDISVDETYLNDMTGLLTLFAPQLDGYILYSNSNESNSALTMASATEGNVIVATESCGSSVLLESLGVSMVGSVVGLDSKQVRKQIDLNSKFSSSLLSDRMIAFAPNDGSKASCLSGYALFARMAVMEFSYDSDQVVGVWELSLAHLNPNTLNAAMGWFTGGDEYGYVSTVAMQGSAWAHASDWSTNLGTLSNIKTLSNLHTHSSLSHELAQKILYHSDRTVKKEMREVLHNVSGGDAQKHTVSFVMSDGDNLCWLQGGWKSDTWFGAPERQGNGVPIGWTFAPAGAEMIPTVLSYALANSTENDTLIGGPSGAGYTYPGIYYQGVEGVSDQTNRSEAYAQATSELMAAGSMSLLTVIDGAPSVESVQPLLEQSNIDAVVFFTYNDGYSGLRGNVAYVNGKPVIGGRVSLWEESMTGDMVGVSGLIATLQTLPKDPSDPNSYSLIPVHAWSHNYSDVVEAARQLEALGGYEILRPDAFVAKLISETGSKSTCPLASGQWENSCVDCVLSGNGTCVLSCSCTPSSMVQQREEVVEEAVAVSASCDLSQCHDDLYIDGLGQFRCEDGSLCSN